MPRDTEFATIPMDQFALEWRFTDPDVMPPVQLSQIRPLAPGEARRLWDMISAASIHGGAPFTKGLFRTVESTPIAYGQAPEPAEDRRVRRWLHRCGIPFRQRVLLSNQPDLGIVTNWKMLVRHWRHFYRPISDDLTVIDGTLQWALLFHHEHEVHFGTMREGPRLRSSPGT